MLKPILLGALACTLLSGNLTASAACSPTFQGPVASEYIYPTPGSWVNRPISVSNYSMAGVNTAYGNIDLYLSAWTSPGNSEYVWQFAAPGTDPAIPGNLIAQGTFPYSNVRDLEVGFVNDGGGGYHLLVCYWDGGPIPGHKMDIYKLNPGLTAPVFSGTIILSNSQKYGRIRIDCHKTYGVAVAWQYPGWGIQTLVGNNGSYSGVTTLNGTVDEFSPDVAFSHSSGPLNVHYAYQNQITGDITESVIDWPTLLTTPVTFWPTIEDVNPGVSTNDLRLILDCPDHFNVENWAYTYTNNNSDIFVRYVDYNSGTPFTTISVNSGVLGNQPTVGCYKVFAPTIYYGEGYLGASTDHIHVGWYTTDGGGFNGYIDIEMDEKGSSLISAPDYLMLPNAFTGGMYPLRPGLAYSRLSDQGLAPNYMFTNFYDLNGGYNLHHAFHPWGAPVFKGGQPVAIHPECGQEQSALHPVNGIVAVSPNPFTDQVSTTLTLQEAGTVRLELMDITGRVVTRSSETAEKGIHKCSTSGLSTLPAGAYMLNISVNDHRIGQQKVMKQ